MPIYSTTDMPIYALVSLLLLNITITDSTKCAAYTDDISCVAKLRNILTWWNNRIFSWQKAPWSSSWYGGVQKGICDHDSI